MPVMENPAMAIQFDMANVRLIGIFRRQTVRVQVGNFLPLLARAGIQASHHMQAKNVLEPE